MGEYLIQIRSRTSFSDKFYYVHVCIFFSQTDSNTRDLAFGRILYFDFCHASQGEGMILRLDNRSYKQYHDSNITSNKYLKTIDSLCFKTTSV